jgi:hypothetical protein
MLRTFEIQPRSLGNMKSQGITILLVTVSLLCGCRSRPKDVSQIIKSTRDAVVLVKSFNDQDTLIAQGSGFFVSRNEVVTNKHVIEYAKRVEVRTAPGKSYLVTYVTGDGKEKDLIKLGIDTREDVVTPIDIACREPEVGEKVVVVGAPLGLEGTASEGIVSSVRESPLYGRIIQMTASISPGSSGSPVLDAEGKVIAIVTFYLRGGQNINFAIPARGILEMVPETLVTMSDWRRRVLKALYGRPEKEKRRLAGIRSATEWEYSSLYGEMTRDGEIMRDGRKESYSMYDPQGNEVERIEYDVSGNVIMRSTDRYDEQGRAIEGTYSGPSDSRPEYWRNRYDARGSCVEVVTYTRGESTKTVSKFDKRGMEIEALTYDGTEHLKKRAETAYDDRGNKTEASIYDGKGNVTYRSISICRYDEKGNLIEESGSRSIMQTTSRTITRYRYDQQGRKLEEATSYYNPDGTLRSSEVLSFDEYERLVTKIKTSDRDNRTESYHYDGNSNLTEVIGDNRSELGQWRYTRCKKYDEYGNLTEEVASGGNIMWRKPYYTTTIIRYEYYSDRKAE